MIVDIRTLLADQGIHLRRHEPGEHRAACPKCNRKRDDALAVKIDDKGATWTCHRAGCGWKGAVCDKRRAESKPRDLPFQAMMDRLRDATVQPAQPQPARPRPITGPLEIWANAKPIRHTHAETYLRRRNLLDSEHRAVVAWNHLRFHPSCQMGTHGRFPALIVAINDPTGELVAVQRIAVTPEGTKAALAKPKIALGPIKGGAARLADWRTTDTLALTEGVEDALAFMLLTGTPTWAACGGGMIQSMVLPKAIANVVIVADADEAGMKAARGAHGEFKSQGRNVCVVRPVDAKDPAEIVGRAA
jgi:DNA primase